MHEYSTIRPDPLYVKSTYVPPFLHIASFAPPEPTSAPAAASQCPPLPSPAHHDPEITNKNKRFEIVSLHTENNGNLVSESLSILDMES